MNDDILLQKDLFGGEHELVPQIAPHLVEQFTPFSFTLKPKSKAAAVSRFSELERKYYSDRDCVWKMMSDLCSHLRYLENRLSKLESEVHDRN